MHEFDLTSVTSVPGALQTLTSSLGRARFLAGGTTLVDLMKLNVESPDHLVDITRIPELAAFDVSVDKDLVFGSLVRMSDVADHKTVKERYPVLSESLWKAASQQLRNMATLGGNLLQRTRCAYFRDVQYPCNKRSPGSGCSAQHGLSRGHALLGGSEACIAVYPGDFAVALVALDAMVDTVSSRGARSIPMAQLHRQPGDTPHIETSLAPDELIVRIRIPGTRLGKASTYQKIRDRESYAFALTAAAVALEMDGDKVSAARIALGGVATVPWRARNAERSLIGKPLTEASASDAGRVAFEGAVTRPQSAFRVRLGIETVAEALTIARKRA
jgi:xanthine dehydrogenase YagS FAD-binding subunit